MINISVIIVAHKNRGYLLQAIKSVVNQTLDKSQYEIIIVKNFSDKTIDNFIKNIGAKNILTSIPTKGGKLVLGIKCASGNILVFLDDDDLFKKEKLMTVYGAFSDYFDLGYYHDGFRYINTKNHILHERHSLVKTTLYIKNMDKMEHLSLILDRAGSALGSCAIRKNIVLGHMKTLSKIISRSDTFLFYLAMISEYSILLDCKKLTFYRIHNSESNFVTGDYKKFINWLILRYKAAIYDLPLIISIAKTRHMEKQLLFKLIDYKLILSLTKKNHHNYLNLTDLIWALTQYNYYKGSKLGKSAFLQYGILYLIYPKLARLRYNKNYLPRLYNYYTEGIGLKTSKHRVYS